MHPIAFFCHAISTWLFLTTAELVTKSRLCLFDRQGPRRPPDASGPSFIDALHNQLGIKLVPQKGPYGYLIVDHIEQPTAN
jgi:hypothetical protein